MVEYTGYDVSKEETAFCVRDKEGRVLARGKAATDPEALKARCLCPERIVMETGTQSHWLVRGLRARGLPVALIDARQAHAVIKLQHHKTDANDAALLAEIARTGFCRPVAVKSEDAQDDRMLLKARARLVGQRRALENTIRGLLASLGHRKGVAKFAGRVRAIMTAHPEFATAIAPLLRVRAALEASLEDLDKTSAPRTTPPAGC